MLPKPLNPATATYKLLYSSTANTKRLKTNALNPTRLATYIPNLQPLDLQQLLHPQKLMPPTWNPPPQNPGSQNTRNPKLDWASASKVGRVRSSCSCLGGLCSARLLRVLRGFVQSGTGGDDWKVLENLCSCLEVHGFVIILKPGPWQWKSLIVVQSCSAIDMLLTPMSLRPLLLLPSRPS